MSHWKTTLRLTVNDKHIETSDIQIKRGIFQGDSLSPLWFCLSLNPLSKRLNDTNYGYKIKNKHTNDVTLSHLLYMDDIKIYASNIRQLK